MRQAIAAYRRRWPGLEVTPAAVAKHWHVLTGPGGGGAPAQGARAVQDGPRLAQLNWNGVPVPPPPAGDVPARPDAGYEGPRLAQLNWNGVPVPLPPAGDAPAVPDAGTEGPRLAQLNWVTTAELRARGAPAAGAVAPRRDGGAP